MYIINECTASYTSRYEQCFLGAEEGKLNPGDSFGEGIVISWERTCTPSLQFQKWSRT